MQWLGAGWARKEVAESSGEVQLSDGRVGEDGQQDGIRHGNPVSGARSILYEAAGDAASVVATAGYGVVFHADEAAGMMVMGENGHDRHDDADQKKQINDVSLLLFHAFLLLADLLLCTGLRQLMPDELCLPVGFSDVLSDFGDGGKHLCQFADAGGGPTVGGIHGGRVGMLSPILHLEVPVTVHADEPDDIAIFAQFVVGLFNLLAQIGSLVAVFRSRGLGKAAIGG